MSNLSAELSFLQEQSRLVVLLIIFFKIFGSKPAKA